MLRAIIIDDERHANDRLAMLIKRYCSTDVHLVAQDTQLSKGIISIAQCRPDLLFLDIDLGVDNAFDLLKHFPQPSFSVIFTTAYAEYSLKAIKLSALDYLLKPIDPDELMAAVAKKKKMVQQPDFSLLFDHLHTLQQKFSKITVPTLTGFELINIEEIIRCQSDINYTTIYLKRGKTLLVARTIKEFEEILVPHQFYRIHQSHLVNLRYIKSYHRGKGGSVLLEDGQEFPVSSRRKEGFLQIIHQLAHFR